MIGIIADLGGQIEGNAQSGLALLQKVTVATVRFLGGGESGILTHRPEPAAVHAGLNATPEGILARIPQRLFKVNVLNIFSGVQGRYFNTRG